MTDRRVTHRTLESGHLAE